MKRRSFFLLAPLACAVLLTACGKQSTDANSDGTSKVLNVYNWSDYIAPDTIANFEQATGIKVNYDVYAENETLETKLATGNSGYDVVFPSARPFAQRQVQGGLFAPLDKAVLTNWHHLDPAILQGLQDIDPGNTHVVPYMWGTTGLGINADKVREILGENVALDSWDLLFKPENAAKLASCGITVLDDEQEAFAAALIWLGRNPNEASAENIAHVQQAYAAIRPYIRNFNNAQYKDGLANGDVCLAMGYSGDVGQARDVAVEAAEKMGQPAPDIRYIIPREGAVRWVDVVAVPKDAPNKANAMLFINYLMQPEVSAAITNVVAYANPNLNATTLVDAAIANDTGVYPPEQVRAKLVDPQALPDGEQRQRVRAWTTIKSGR